VSTTFYAHTLPGKPTADWEPLRDHLEQVARRAGEFASTFSAEAWGRVAGLWHDLGKYSKEFQARLFRENGLEAHLEGPVGRVNHSTAGAKHAIDSFTGEQGLRGRILAYCIAGHHAGLADAIAEAGQSGLDQRLREGFPSVEAAPAELLALPTLPMPKLTLTHGDRNRAAFQLALFTRMLFSCLVDADFLGTEELMQPVGARARQQQAPTLQELKKALDRHLAELGAQSQGATNVSDCRQLVLAACHAAAQEPPGLFSLTVPTGGGKTLASLAFAIDHALRHGFERVIYAIPFTSIIEQTAEVFRDRAFAGLSPEAVVEHHSNLDPDDETFYSRLAKENWDAPIVVTTNVQFFESLFASRTSQCRKLHRIVNSVVILDEAQTLPVDLLKPCLAVLRELAVDYHCSIVLCTATQPAITRQPEFTIGLENVREIIPDPPELYNRMKRVRVHNLGQLSDSELIERLGEHQQFLCVVNTRPHAAKVFTLLSETLSAADRDGVIHLSTWMCGAHRSEVIADIRQRLQDGKSCRVVSTQLIEAGVDVDFPVVYRALAGIDSIAQAAGRCNREGKAASGDVFVFEPTAGQPPGYLASTADSARELLTDFDDLLSLEAVQHYFELHYWKQNKLWDKKGVMEQFPAPAQKVAFQFRTAARLFQMIEEDTQPIIIPWGSEGQALVRALEASEPPDWRIKRKLQRYVVGVYPSIYQKLLATGDVIIRHNSYAVLCNLGMYNDKLGLRLGE
jgi:CRISPR-associated endonuclease/helicase Cas3